MKSLTKINSILTPNRGSWTKLVVNVPTNGRGLQPYYELAKSKGVRWCDFIADALFVGASNLRETGVTITSPPKSGQTSSLLPDRRCYQCVRGRN